MSKVKLLLSTVKKLINKNTISNNIIILNEKLNNTVFKFNN